MDEFVAKLKTDLQFDHNIEQRRIVDWHVFTFFRFRRATGNTSNIKHTFSHYEDLPDYMRSDLLLLQRIGDVFRNDHW